MNYAKVVSQIEMNVKLAMKDSIWLQTQIKLFVKVVIK